MIDLGRCTGESAWGSDVLVLPGAVYVNSNHEKYEEEINGEIRTFYTYDCVMYSPEEYAELVGKENKRLENELTDTQMALADTFEASIATADDLTETQLALAEVYELVIGG